MLSSWLVSIFENIRSALPTTSARVENAIAVAVEFLGMSPDEATHRTAGTAATVLLGLGQFAILVGVVAGKRLGCFADNFFAADDFVLVQVDFLGMNQEPGLPRAFSGLRPFRPAILNRRWISIGPRLGPGARVPPPISSAET